MNLRRLPPTLHSKIDSRVSLFGKILQLNPFDFPFAYFTAVTRSLRWILLLERRRLSHNLNDIVDSKYVDTSATLRRMSFMKSRGDCDRRRTHIKIEKIERYGRITLRNAKKHYELSENEKKLSKYKQRYCKKVFKCEFNLILTYK